jgi:NitT/TauT family transport system substrate-binding protein
LERVNLNYFSKTETKKLTQNYFKEIKDMYPEMIGGKLPDEEFYY